MKYCYHVSYQASTKKNETFFGDATVSRPTPINSFEAKQSIREGLIRINEPRATGCVILNIALLRIEDEDGNEIERPQATSIC